MKKTLIMILCLVLMLSMFTACGRDELEQAGVDAIEVADAYLDGEIDANTAFGKLAACKEQVPDNGDLKNTLIRSYITNMESGLFMATQTDGQSYSGGYLLAQRNEFARYLEVAER